MLLYVLYEQTPQERLNYQLPCCIEGNMGNSSSIDKEGKCRSYNRENTFGFVAQLLLFKTVHCEFRNLEVQC